MKAVALIPARSGSVRVPDKNIYNIGGHPLLAYTIDVAKKSRVFDEILVVTDSELYKDIAIAYGAQVPGIRPSIISSSTSADIDWVKWIFNKHLIAEKFDIFSILRPTSPLRTVKTIQKAFEKFISLPKCDSLRAVSIANEHPGKMWRKSGELINPLLPFDIDGVPWHSNQIARLPQVFTQNASLEIAWVNVITEMESISGNVVKAFETEGLEGFDINVMEDLLFLEFLIERNKVSLPKIELPKNS